MKKNSVDIKFLEETLEALRAQIRTEGAVIKTKNGTIKKNPAIDAYSTLLGRYKQMTVNFEVVKQNDVEKFLCC